MSEKGRFRTSLARSGSPARVRVGEPHKPHYGKSASLGSGRIQPFPRLCEDSSRTFTHPEEGTYPSSTLDPRRRTSSARADGMPERTSTSIQCSSSSRMRASTAGASVSWLSARSINAQTRWPSRAATCRHHGTIAALRRGPPRRAGAVPPARRCAQLIAPTRADCQKAVQRLARLYRVDGTPSGAAGDFPNDVDDDQRAVWVVPVASARCQCRHRGWCLTWPRQFGAFNRLRPHITIGLRPMGSRQQFNYWIEATMLKCCNIG
jgi:hypothetical protein